MKRMSSITLITAQPWTSSSLPTATGIGGVRPAPPPVGGLTDTLLQEFEERRAQQKLEESSVSQKSSPASPSDLLLNPFPLQYAGILRLDHINHEVNILFPLQGALQQTPACCASPSVH